MRSRDRREALGWRMTANREGAKMGEQASDHGGKPVGGGDASASP